MASPPSFGQSLKKLWRLRNNFPAQAHVLNIYGNLQDGSHSDGVITMPSARSLGYLLKNRVASYQEYQVQGPTAQHSKLHENNPFVDDALIDYLWRKDGKFK
nr:alpha/beta hydrolase [Secundilactobacillus odoratitofui]